MSDYNDYPLSIIAEAMTKQIKRGATCFQKFTCAGCGNRLTQDVPNVLYTKGTCDNCDAITDIEKQGCNFMFILAVGVSPIRPETTHVFECWAQRPDGKCRKGCSCWCHVGESN